MVQNVQIVIRSKFAKLDSNSAMIIPLKNMDFRLALILPGSGFLTCRRRHASGTRRWWGPFGIFGGTSSSLVGWARRPERISRKIWYNLIQFRS